jgi:hypothetical protein
MPSASQLSAAGSVLVLASACAWLVLSEFPVADPGHPTTSAGPLQVLEAAMPAIGDFSDFNVNANNPFIPKDLRIIERDETLRPPPKKNTGSGPGPGPQPEPVKPQLPTLAAPGQTGPAVTGVLLSQQLGPQAMITFPGGKGATVMKPGESVNGWTLIAVVGGNIVRLKDDASGTTHEFAVPETDNAPSDAPKAKDDSKKDDSKKAEGKPEPKDAKAAKGVKDKSGKKPKVQPGESKPSENGDKPAAAPEAGEMAPPEGEPKPPRKPPELPRTM